MKYVVLRINGPLFEIVKTIGVALAARKMDHDESAMTTLRVVPL